MLSVADAIPLHVLGVLDRLMSPNIIPREPLPHSVVTK